MIAADIWVDMSDTPALAASALELPITDYVLSNYSFYIMFIFVISALGTYVKLGTSQGGGI